MKLEVRDKIIEKLVSRLDKLEDILVAKGDLKEKVKVDVKALISEHEESIKEKLTELALQNSDIDEAEVDVEIEKEERVEEKTVTKKKKK